MRTPRPCCGAFLFFFNDTATTEIYTLSLHDALPISALDPGGMVARLAQVPLERDHARSEEHTSELQSPYLISHAVFCLKKKTNTSDWSRVKTACPFVARRGCRIRR